MDAHFFVAAELTPSSFTSYIGSADTKFQCRAYHLNRIWFIEGLSRGTKELSSRGIVTTETIENNITHVFNSNLTVEARLANNNTSIKCAVITDGVLNYSQEVRFYVQGKPASRMQQQFCDSHFPIFSGFLDQPPNMNINQSPINGSLFHLLTWDPPLRCAVT